MRHFRIFLVLTLVAWLGNGAYGQEINDSFSDGNFTAAPVWSGDVADWEVVSSTASSGAIGSNTLHQNVAVTGPGTTYLSTPCSNWLDAQNWSFFVGRRNRAFQSSNYVEIWLYANEANLESATVDGYCLRIGNLTNSLELQRMTNGVGSTILSSPAFTNNSVLDCGIAIEVIRDNTGQWTLMSSPIPSTNGTGVTADLDPLTQTTLTHGTVTDIVYTPSGTGYCGYLVTYSGSSVTREAAELDSFVLSTSSTNTEIEFTAPTSSIVSESGGSLSIPISILNPSPTLATVADIVLTSGTASRIGSYTTQTITFPAGSSATQFVNVTLTDNLDCDGNEIFTFEVQNVSGGISAIAGVNDLYTMTMIDDEQGSDNLITDNFDSGSIASWKQSNGGDWTVEGVTPINGAFSLRHSNLGVAGNSSISREFGNTKLSGVSTHWRFNFNAFSNDPTPTEYFLFYLTANEEDMTSATVDGYAVGIQPATLVSPDLISLYKMENGAISATLVSSALDYGAAYDIVGVEVTRDENGLWELLLDDDGGFDNLVSAGTATNTDFDFLDFAGVKYSYSVATSGGLMVDDYSIDQMGCSVTYYSQTSGHASTAVWDLVPLGTPGIAQQSKFTSFIIQNGHTIDLTQNMNSDEIIIDAGGVLNLNSFELNIYNNFYINGTFNGGTGHVWMNAPGYAEMGNAAGTTSFYDVTIYSNGGDIIQLGNFEIENVFSPRKGFFDTDGNSFTLLSDASNTASIGMMTNESDFYGNVTLQRFVPNGPQNWVYIGNSLTGATLTEWDDDFATTGFTGSQWPSYPFINITQFDETVPGTEFDGFYYPSNITDALDHENGYAVYLVAGATTVDVTGQFQRMNISDPLDYTNSGNPAYDGLNLLVNRYPSEINFDQLYDNSTASVTSATYYLYDGDVSGFKSYNAITNIGTAPATIPSSQSFMVQAGGLGESLEYDESVKSNNNTMFERDYQEVQQIAISMNKEEVQDMTYIAFTEGATDDFDQLYDANKLYFSDQESFDIKISSQFNDHEYAVNVLPDSDESVSIPLLITNMNGGEVSINIENIEGFEEGTCLVIEDLVEGTMTPLEEGLSFTFTTSEEYDEIRYILHSGTPISATATDETCEDSNDGTVVAQGAGEGPFDYTWYNESGDVILEETGVFGSSEMTDLPFGNYTVEIYDENSICTTGSTTVYIGQGTSGTVSMEVTEDSCDPSEGGFIEINPDFDGAYDYEIYNAFGDLVVNGNTVGTLMEELPGDNYDVVVNTGCSIIELEADLVDLSAVYMSYDNTNMEVTLDGGEYVMNFDADIQNADLIVWTIDDQVVSNMESFDYTFTEVGTYLVTVVAESADCSTSLNQLITVNEIISVDDIANNEIALIQNQDGLMITFDQYYENATIELINTLGQIVISNQVVSGAGTVTNQKISQLSEGSYVVRISSNDQVIYTQQIVR